MKKSRYSEEQIIGILKQHEAGVKTADVCREHGISAATFYGWKQKFGGMDVSEAQRLKAMEDENRRLKLLVAELSLHGEALKAVIFRASVAVGHRDGRKRTSLAFRHKQPCRNLDPAFGREADVVFAVHGHHLPISSLGSSAVAALLVPRIHEYSPKRTIFDQMADRFSGLGHWEDPADRGLQRAFIQEF